MAGKAGGRTAILKKDISSTLAILENSALSDEITVLLCGTVL